MRHGAACGGCCFCANDANRSRPGGKWVRRKQTEMVPRGQLCHEVEVPMGYGPIPLVVPCRRLFCPLRSCPGASARLPRSTAQPAATLATTDSPPMPPGPEPKSPASLASPASPGQAAAAHRGRQAELYDGADDVCPSHNCFHPSISTCIRSRPSAGCDTLTLTRSYPATPDTHTAYRNFPDSHSRRL